MKEILELMFATDGNMFVTVIILLIITTFLYNILNSLFSNLFGKRRSKTKIKKVYVDEFGDEVDYKEV